LFSSLIVFVLQKLQYVHNVNYIIELVSAC
jgi:hypothetical protein